MTFLTATYLAYLAASAFITVYVARTLHRCGRPFLVDVFHGNETLADAVNRLLVVGFYLVNIAFVAFNLKAGLAVHTVLEAGELLSAKLGLVLLTLGVMHFGNLVILTRVRCWKDAWHAPKGRATLG